jgi:hypothetical protein
MMLFTLLLRLIVPEAHAVVLNTWSNNPAVQSMWASICSVVPFCNLGLTAPGYFAAKVISFVFSLIGGVALLVMLWAGIQIIFSVGEEDKIGEARKLIQYALGGLVAAILGYSAVPYVVSVVIPQLFG